jgi:LPXTG-site transpeptidase (sortase) family protein
MNRAWRLAVLSPLVLAVVMISSGSSELHQADASALSNSTAAASVIGTVAVPTPSPTARVMRRSIPVRLSIPSIGLVSRLMKLGLQKDGSLQVPPSGFPAGWYTGSPTPGQLGPAVIAGHIDWKGTGVFYHLKLIEIGDQINIDRADGTTAKFVVTKIASFLKSKFPTSAVYGNLTYPGLRLITCGDYDFTLHKYVRDLVVFAALV